MTTISEGGRIDGPGTPVAIRYAGTCPHGHDLIQFRGLNPEHIIRPADRGRWWEIVDCQRRMEQA